MIIGIMVFLIIVPSWFEIFNTELTATMLFIHTIFPIAPPTDCKARTSATEMPVVSAVES